MNLFPMRCWFLEAELVCKIGIQRTNCRSDEVTDFVTEFSSISTASTMDPVNDAAQRDNHTSKALVTCFLEETVPHIGVMACMALCIGDI